MRRYGGMPGAYRGANPHRGAEVLTDPAAMGKMGHLPLAPATLWELMAGAGGLIKQARVAKTRHLPPVDYRWGWNLGRLPDHFAAMYGLIVHG